MPASPRRPPPKALLFFGGGVALIVVVLVGINLSGAKSLFVLPTPTPVPIADRERDLVTSYYSDISQRNLQEAYNRLSPAVKKTAAFSTWTKAYDTTVATSISNVAVANDTVSFRLNQRDKTNAGTLTSLYDGQWRIIEPGGLRLDNERLALLYKSYFSDNPPNRRSTADTYAKLKPSLAFVLTRTADDQIGSGTAFCVGSDESDSYYLTSLHVVPDDSEIFILPVGQALPKGAEATVMFRDSAHDAAIIQAHIPAVPVLMLAKDLPREGQSVGIAGFPFMQIEIAAVENIGTRGLTPSLHLGTVNALTSQDSMIEFDATTDHGNSGGPLFDPSTGQVYGIVTAIAPGDSQAVQGSFATSMRSLWPFIEQSKVRVLTSNGP